MDVRTCVRRGPRGGETDIAVLAPTSPVAVVGAQPVLAGRLAYGQQVASWASPSGGPSGGEELTNGYPLPFVKAGIVSAILAPPTGRAAQPRSTSTPRQPGVQRRPLVYEPVETQERFGIAGVISDILVESSTKKPRGIRACRRDPGGGRDDRGETRSERLSRPWDRVDDARRAGRRLRPYRSVRGRLARRRLRLASI